MMIVERNLASHLFILYYTHVARTFDRCIISLIMETFSNVFMRMTLYPRILKMMDEVCEGFVRRIITKNRCLK